MKTIRIISITLIPVVLLIIATNFALAQEITSDAASSVSFEEVNMQRILVVMSLLTIFVTFAKTLKTLKFIK